MMLNFSVMKDIARLLGDEWDLGKTRSNATGNVRAWIYLMKILEETDVMLTTDYGGNVIGVCGVRRFHTGKGPFLKSVYRAVGNMLMNSWLVKDKGALKEYYGEYGSVRDEIKKLDGEISILIVDKRYRGKGHGKWLFEKACKICGEVGMRKLGIETSDSCNLGFYEGNGCVKVYETSVKSSESAWRSDNVEKKAYVYMKEL